jgi:hypothetical protein
LGKANRIDSKTRRLKMELELRFELSKVLPIADVLYRMMNSLPNIATVEI